MTPNRLTAIRARRERVLDEDTGVVNEVYVNPEVLVLVQDDVPDLLAEIERLQERIDEMEDDAQQAAWERSERD